MTNAGGVHWQHGRADHFRFFKLKEQIGISLVEKLESNDIPSQYFVMEHFLYTLPDVVLNTYRIQRCVKAISSSIRNDNTTIRNSLVDKINSLPEDWQKKFVESLKDLIDEENPAHYLYDGTPFIAKDIPFADVTDVDIPF